MRQICCGSGRDLGVDRCEIDLGLGRRHVRLKLVLAQLVQFARVYFRRHRPAVLHNIFLCATEQDLLRFWLRRQLKAESGVRLIDASRVVGLA